MSNRQKMRNMQKNAAGGARPIRQPRILAQRSRKIRWIIGEGDRRETCQIWRGNRAVQINDGGRDFEVTVEFDGAGREKMFASFAKLRKSVSVFLW